MRPLLALASLLLFSSGPAFLGLATAVASDDAAVLVGRVTRDEVEKSVPSWVEAEVEAQLDIKAAQGLLWLEEGSKVTVYLGTWCSDSRRELARLWRALDEIGGWVPFEIDYIAVSRSKKKPRKLVKGIDLQYVPTFIVERDGREVGRIVETSPNGIEHDLLALLTGEAEGTLTTRDDL